MILQWSNVLPLAVCLALSVSPSESGAAFVHPNKASVETAHANGLPLSAPLVSFLPRNSGSRNSSTRLNMVFDFFRKRGEEGIEQLSKLSEAASRGELGAGLKDAAAYTRDTNKAFADGLAKSRNRLLSSLEGFMLDSGGADALDDLQDILLQADLGTITAESIVEEVRQLREGTTKFLSRTDLMSVMRGQILESLETDQRAINFAQMEECTSQVPHMPTVIFVLGANGMGKTTTIGKLAHRLRNEGNQTILMAACDTFRAGAVDQLQLWANRAQVDIYGPTETATSPSAILYDALDKAVKEKYDTLLVDTSGRLSNNEALTAELVKMKKVIQKRLSVENDAENGKPILNTDVPHESLLVIDAAQGRMALDSARIWNDRVGISGLVLTKLDGSARGGSVVAVSRDLNLPVKLIGVGEGMNDLKDFNPELFVDSLLGIDATNNKIGKTKLTEGDKLAERLKTLRQERAGRSSAIKEKVVVSSPALAPQAGQTVPGNLNRPKNKRKKRGKR